eukprot:202857-Chlamydomonas_euryale.AAC.3
MHAGTHAHTHAHAHTHTRTRANARTVSRAGAAAPLRGCWGCQTLPGASSQSRSTPRTARLCLSWHRRCHACASCRRAAR